MQLYFVLFFLFAAIYLAPFDRRLSFFISSLYLILLPFFLRFGPIQSDMLVYTGITRLPFSDLFVLYYLREGLFWFPFKIISSLIPPPYSLLVFDYIILFLFYQNFRILKLPIYFLIPITIFFPFFLGFENIYRSLFAAVVFTFILLRFYNQGFLIKLLLSLIPILIHNSSIIFLPLLFFSNTKSNSLLKITSLFIAGLSSFFFIYYFQNYTEYSDVQLTIGADYSLYYVFLILLITLFFLLSQTLFNYERPILSFGIYCLIVSYNSTYLPSVLSERISLFGLMIVTPFILVVISNIKHLPSRILSYFIVSFMLALPTLFNPSTLIFLL